MNFLSNIKDTLSTISGWAGGIGLIVFLSASEFAKIGIVFPDIIITIGGICTAVSLIIIGVLNGKNPNLSTKTDQQVVKANKESIL